MNPIFKKRLFVSLLSSTLLTAFLISPGYGMNDGDNLEESFNKNRSYLSSSTEEERKQASTFFKETAVNLSHPQWASAVAVFLEIGTEEEKKITAAALYEIIKNKSNPQYFHAAKLFMNGLMGYYGDHLFECSEGTLLNLLPLFSLENDGTLGSWLSHLMLQSPYSAIQGQAEEIFLNNPLKFLSTYSETHAVYEFVVSHEDSKKHLWHQKISAQMIADDGRPESQLNAASLILLTADQQDVLTPAKNLLLNLMDQHEGPFVTWAKMLLSTIQDTELKEQIITCLFNLAKTVQIKENSEKYSSKDNSGSFSENEDESYSEEDDGNSNPLSALHILLKQKDEKIRIEAISVCDNLIKSNQIRGNNSLVNMGLALFETREGKSLAQQISSLLQPKLEQIILSEDYDLLDNIINLFIYTKGAQDPLTQELIQWGIKYAEDGDENNPFFVFKRLCEEMSQPVKHSLPTFQLDDNRVITFNLKTLQKRRTFCFIPMQHKDLVSCTEKLLAEAKVKPEAFKLLAHQEIAKDHQVAIKTVNDSFFRNLLDADGEMEPQQNKDLMSFKLRRILKEVKELQEKEEISLTNSEKLSSSSRIILSLLNNQLECDVGKDIGIDSTYRLLTNRRSATEEQMKQEQLREEVEEFFYEDMRCKRENLLKGPVICSLSGWDDNQDNTHDIRYLESLLGHEIGTHLEGQEEVSFDGNAGVSTDLLECSKQVALDTLYQHFKPEDVINSYYENFKEKGFTGKIVGKNNNFKIIYEYFTGKELQNAGYFVLDEDEIATNFKKLAMIEILLRANILEVLENQ